MTIEEPPPMFDDDFQKDCLRRHPTARIALGELRKQGKPPKPSHFDLSSPSPRVNAVIEIMGSLAANLQKTAGGDGGLATQIMNDWTSLLGPWVKFFLEDFILADEEPYTPEGALALERVLTVIPGSFTSLYKPAEPRFLALKHLSPFFVPCITQVTFKLMDEAHPKWVLWSSLLSDMFMDDSEPTHGIDYLPRRVLYSFEEPSLGLLFVRHINHLTPRVRVMSKSEMTVLSNLVALVDNMETNPLHLTSVREEAIPALIRLASAVLLKRKLSPRTSPDGIYNNVHALATVAMKQLAIILREPRFVFQALEADLVQVILKIPRYVFQCDDRGPDSTERLIHWVSMILDNISRLMINTSVFRRLLARVRRVTAEDSLEVRVRGSSEVVWERWERTKKKVVMLHEWRESIKNDGLVLCANHECPWTSLPGSGTAGERVNLKYFRCSSCESVFYCSYSCQAADWKSHKDICQSIREAQITGIAFGITQPDHRYSSRFLALFYTRNLDLITKRVNRFVADLPADREDQRLIQLRRKNPILYINFNIPNLLTVNNCVKVIDPTKIKAEIQGIPDPKWLEKFVQKWRYEGDGGSIWIVGVVPKNNGEPFPFDLHYGFSESGRVSDEFP